MDNTHEAADEQAALWNGSAGRAWVDAQELLDRIFTPLGELLVEAAHAGSARRVLDVGCGTGGTTLAVAQRLGASGRCVGVDLSEPMIAMARARAERAGVSASFIRDDAQTHAFESATFDLIISRFGVMFFDDAIQAFANLRHAASSDAGLRFIAWRSPEDNPFMTTAERAAAPLLPSLPVRRPDAPGQFAFADPHRIHRTLRGGGWDAIDIQSIDVACVLQERELERYFTRLGPLGRILHELDDRTRARVVEAVRAAFDPYVHAAEVRFNAACWMVDARAQSS